MDMILLVYQKSRIQKNAVAFPQKHFMFLGPKKQNFSWFCTEILINFLVPLHLCWDHNIIFMIFEKYFALGWRYLLFAKKVIWTNEKSDEKRNKKTRCLFRQLCSCWFDMSADKSASLHSILTCSCCICSTKAYL